MSLPDPRRHNVTPSDVLETLERLDERERGYGKRMLPDPLDEAIARVVDFVVQAAPDEREDVKTLIGDTQAWFLLAYGERMASLGLRRTSAPIVLSGLTAVALASAPLFQGDPRRPRPALPGCADARRGPSGAVR